MGRRKKKTCPAWVKKKKKKKKPCKKWGKNTHLGPFIQWREGEDHS